MQVVYYNDSIRCYSDGRIERLFRGKYWREVQQTSFDKKGYLKLTINGKTEKWHKVIWIAFNGGIPNGYHIHHKDGNPSNNSLENLECLSRPQHDEEHHEAKVNGKLSKPVIGINIKTGEKIEFPSAKEADRNGFANQQICACCKGRRKSHKGYRWYYK